jgi:DNA-binding LacI/PurR family transcriptional regulator
MTPSNASPEDSLDLSTRRPAGRAMLADVAAAAGVSKSTASRALSGRDAIAPATRERVRAAAARLGFKLNPFMRTLMTQVREGEVRDYQATIAWLDGNTNTESWRGEPVQADFYAGAARRATELGYTLTRFSACSPGMTPDRLTNMLLARGIHGVLLVNSPHYVEDGLPPPLRLDDIACVMVGERTNLPGLNYAINDTHLTAREAHLRMRALGYRRVGFVSNTYAERCVTHSFIGGYASVLGDHGENFPAPVFSIDVGVDNTEIGRWALRHKLDAILCNYCPTILNDLAPHGLIAGRDIGLATTTRSAHPLNISGMDQQLVEVGAAAMDLLDGQLQRSLFGQQAQPHGALISSKWVDGETLPPKTVKKPRKRG